MTVKVSRPTFDYSKYSLMKLMMQLLNRLGFDKTRFQFNQKLIGCYKVLDWLIYNTSVTSQNPFDDTISKDIAIGKRL